MSEKRFSNRKRRGCLLPLLVVAALLAILSISNCTIAPKGAQPPKIPSDWAKTNVLGYDSTGYKVTAEWIRVYHAMIKTYGSKLPINEQVTPDDMGGIIPTPSANIYHVSFGTNKRFTDLKEIESDSGP